MAKIKIYFKGQQYEVDDQLLAEAASAIQGRLAALSGGSTDPDVPDEPDTPVVTFNLAPGMYQEGAIALAMTGDYATASSMQLQTWDELIEEEIFAVDENVLRRGTQIDDKIDYYVGLQDIVIPEGIEILGQGLFDMWKVNAVYIPEGVTEVQLDAFSSWNGYFDSDTSEDVSTYTSYYLPSTLVTVDGYGGNQPGFVINDLRAYCNIKFNSEECDYWKVLLNADGTFMTNIVIPSGVSVIESNSFNGLSQMFVGYFVENIEVVIPTSVQVINYNAFGTDDVGIFKHVYYEGSEEEWNAIQFGGNNTALTSAPITFNYNQ